MEFNQVMDAAYQHHQAGRFTEAESLYRQALVDRPDHAQILNLLGVVVSQQGRKDEAVELLTRAISVSPNVPGFHCNLALIQIEKGDPQAALASAQRAVALQGDNADAQNVLGAALKMLERFEEAEACFTRALAAKPTFTDALANLGDTYAKLGRAADASFIYAKLLTWQPSHVIARIHQGEMLLKQFKPAEAAEVFQSVIDTHPDDWGAHNNLGVALERMGRIDEAIVHWKRAIEIAPDNPGSFNNLGSLLALAGRPDEAIPFLEKAIAMRPDLADAYNNLGNAYLARLDTDRAMKYYDIALYLRPTHEDAHWNKALLLLQLGDYARGYVEYEWRWRHFAEQARGFRQPLWNGYDIAGKTILVYCEQGNGDMMQFARYARLVAQRGARVIVECQASLVALFQELPGIAGIVEKGKALPPFDVQCPLLSLPYALGMVSPTACAETPYVAPSETLRQQWAPALAPYAGTFKIGLVRAGGAGNSRDRHRSAPPEAFEPLAGHAGVTFFSLQKLEVGTKPLPASLKCVDFTGEFHDFAQTAALISHLDLVITVDTAVAHLAGAMGKPVWTMLAFVADWRWLLKREDCPWYPTMRLFRQTRQGDWDGVMKRIIEELGRISG